MTRDIHKVGAIGEWRELAEDREVEEYRGQGRAEAWCHRASPLIKGRGGGQQQ